MRSVNDVPGLFIQENVIPIETENEIIKWLDSKKWSNTLSRRTQHYGYIYDYKKTDLDPGEPFESWILFLANFLSENKIMNRPDQCIVNEYRREQYIGKHIDGKKGNKPNIFGDRIVSMSLGDDTNIIFRNNQKEVNIYIPRGCLLVMTGDSRYIWTHEIPKLTTINNRCNIIKKRDDYRRISLTFREIVKSK